MTQCPSYLTPILLAYVASIILIILNETVIGGSVPSEFASCARAVNWRNILKKHSALICFPSFLPHKFLLSSSSRSHKRRGICIARVFSSPKGYPSIKVGVVGRMEADSEFRGKWWVSFGALLGRTLVGVVVG